MPSCMRGNLEKPHPDAVDGFFGDVVSQLLEVDLSVKSFPRIGNGAFGKAAETGIASLLLPITIDENHAVIRLLAEGLGNVFIEQYVAIGNDRALNRPFSRSEGLEQGVQLSGFRKIFIVDIGEIGQVHGLFFISSDDYDILDADCIIGVDNMGEDWCALDVDHRLWLVLGEFPQFIAAGRSQYDCTGILSPSWQIPVFGFL